MKVIKKQKTGLKSLKQLKDRNNWEVWEYSGSDFMGIGDEEDKKTFAICPVCGNKEEM